MALRAGRAPPLPPPRRHQKQRHPEGCGAILVDEHDSDGICAAIEQLVTQVDAWPAWSENARQWVAERYAIENIGLRLTARYASALSGR